MDIYFYNGLDGDYGHLVVPHVPRLRCLQLYSEPCYVLRMIERKHVFNKFSADTSEFQRFIVMRIIQTVVLLGCPVL